MVSDSTEIQPLPCSCPRAGRRGAAAGRRRRSRPRPFRRLASPAAPRERSLSRGADPVRRRRRALRRADAPARRSRGGTRRWSCSTAVSIRISGGGRGQRRSCPRLGRRRHHQPALRRRRPGREPRRARPPGQPHLFRPCCCPTSPPPSMCSRGADMRASRSSASARAPTWRSPAAQADPRVSEAIVFNPQRFVWNPAERMEDVIRFGLRSMNDYVGDFRRGGVLRKLVRSRRRLIPAVTFLVKKAARNGMSRLPLNLRSSLLRTLDGRARDPLLRAFRRAGDPASRWSSPPAIRALTSSAPITVSADARCATPNVSIEILQGLDHNLTSDAASSDHARSHSRGARCRGRHETLAHTAAEPFRPRPVRCASPDAA